VAYRALAAIARDLAGPVSIEEITLADLQPHEVLVRIEACGICYTDIKFRNRLRLPAVFGHEGVGVVEEVGDYVSTVRSGDRVILSYPFCTTCPSCRRDQPYACEEIPRLKFGGARTDGSKTIVAGDQPISSAFFQQSSFATHAIALEQSVIKVESDLPSRALAALPCGVQTGAGAVLNTFAMNSTHSLAVFGVGTVGLSAIMAARSAGAALRIAIDIVPQRLALAMSLGATHVIDARQPDVVHQLKKIASKGVTHALDTTAAIPLLEQAIDSLAQGGKVGIVSAPPMGQKDLFSTRGLFERVASLQGIVQGFSVPRRFLPKLLDLQSTGQFPFEKLITPYCFSDINTALADSAAGLVVKPVLIMDAVRARLTSERNVS